MWPAILWVSTHQCWGGNVLFALTQVRPVAKFEKLSNFSLGAVFAVIGPSPWPCLWTRDARPTPGAFARSHAAPLCLCCIRPTSNKKERVMFTLFLPWGNLMCHCKQQTMADYPLFRGERLSDSRLCIISMSSSRALSGRECVPSCILFCFCFIFKKIILVISTITE